MTTPPALFGLEFGWPAGLAFLLLVPAAILAYVWIQRRRSRYAARFTNLDLLATVAAETPGWRRHVPVTAYVLALVALAVAIAQPRADVTVASERSTVILTTDISASMKATDVEPTRLAAAKEAAAAFVEQVPDEVRIGLVAFAGSVQSVVRPTEDHEVVIDAIETLETEPSTSMGDAIVRALADLEASGALDPDPLDGQIASAGGAAAVPVQEGFPDPFEPRGEGGDGDGGGGGEEPPPELDPGPRQDEPEQDEQPGDGGERAPGGGDAQQPPASILLLSDGESTTGSVEPLEAAETARELGVPIYTVALGTDAGEVTVPDQFGRPAIVPVPPDRETLRGIAELTGGAYFEAPSGDELREVYDSLSTRLGTTTEEREITAAFAGAALILVLAGAGLSALWFGRFP